MRSRIFLLLLPLFLSCTVFTSSEQPVRSADEHREDLLTRIRTAVFEKNHREIIKQGKIYLSRYQKESEAPEVRLRVGAADIELGFFRDAAKILLPLLDEEISGEEKGQAYLLLAETDRALGDYAAAAEKIILAMAFELNHSRYLEARGLLSDMVSLLSQEQLEGIRKKYAAYHGLEMVLEGCLAYALAAGDTASIKVIREELSALDSRQPPAETTPPGGPIPWPGGRKEAAVFRIGLICPLDGRFSPLGEAFLRGASLAMKEARLKGMVDLDLVVGDTRASSLQAHLVAERLIEIEKVSALVGGVLSSPTIAAAQVAEYHGVVLYSPVAALEGINKVGPHIFQAEADSEVEIIAIARLACGKMGLRNIAFLAADNMDAHDLENLFRGEVERAGGIICAADFYEPGSTDFKANIERIRESAPEALFIASDAEDLVLILPQLSFYEFGVQLLGTSVWNSKNLLRISGRDMNGAVFPHLDDFSGDEERFHSAAALAGEDAGEANRYIIGGYTGVSKVLNAMAESRISGRQLRDEMSHLLENRQHRFLGLVSGKGIPFSTVRDEKVEEFATLLIQN
ncbi:MAG: amino acid ABC transporter substrate-binding protein [Candidatus Krumholzibacteriota bacterium]|nr:amino acid ABC transporter substrate-binding protein [Candidatus Krumholzibacteriota bacterium]